MNNQEKNKEDLLKQYLNTEKIEKAPEGFTSKVMSRIQVEALPLRPAGRIRNISLVPIVSAVVTILFVVAALLIPGSASESFALPGLNLFNNTKAYLPQIDFTSIIRITPPLSLIYVLAGILILMLFDRILNLFFHRQK